MNLTILSPESKKSLTVTWLEINTPTGNFVIMRGHAPMVITLKPNSPVVLLHTNGAQETFNVAGGIAEINRTSTLLLIKS